MVVGSAPETALSVLFGTDYIVKVPLQIVWSHKKESSAALDASQVSSDELTEDNVGLEDDPNLQDEFPVTVSKVHGNLECSQGGS